jgi:hypothetical protein
VVVKFVSRAQRVAVVAECWRKGLGPAEIAEYLELSEGEVASVVAHLEWCEKLHRSGVLVEGHRPRQRR